LDQGDERCDNYKPREFSISYFATNLTKLLQIV
jgi:hypothetical protein